MAERGITVTEAARRVRENLPEGAGFATANLSHYRSGRSVPRLPYLKALSLALGVDTTDLLGAAPIIADIPATQPAPSETNLTENKETIFSQDNLPQTDTPSWDTGGCAVTKKAQPDQDQSQVPDPEPTVDQTETAPKNILHVEDFGSEVRIQVDQRLPWDKALQILQVLKSLSDD
jgi:hypothetical protein